MGTLRTTTLGMTSLIFVAVKILCDEVDNPMLNRFCNIFSLKALGASKRPTPSITVSGSKSLNFDNQKRTVGFSVI